MRFPRLARRPTGPIRLELAPLIQLPFAILFKQTHPVTRDWALSTVGGWLRCNAPAPFDDMVDFLQTDLLRWETLPIAGFPRGDVITLRTDEETLHRFNEADTLLLVHGVDRLTAPRFGLWATLGAVRALAQALDGAVVDLSLRLLLPADAVNRPIPEDGRIVANEHAVFYASTDRRNLAWVTSKGLSKFGLPELEIRDAQPDLAERLGDVLLTTGYCLMRRVFQAGQILPDPPRRIEVERDLRITQSDLAAALGWEGPDTDIDPGRGAVVGLQWTGRRTRGGDTFLRLVPPEGCALPYRVWLNDLVGELFGFEDDIVRVRSDDELMEEAHLRAIAELPDARRLLDAGLGVGQVLYVKLGFTCADGAVEYMWITVSSWRAGKLRGTLANDPQLVADLRAGQTVEVAETDVYDWMLADDTGILRGGYTARAAMQGEYEE